LPSQTLPRWGREPGSSPQRGEAGRGAERCNRSSPTNHHPMQTGVWGNLVPPTSGRAPSAIGLGAIIGRIGLLLGHRLHPQRSPPDNAQAGAAIWIGAHHQHPFGHIVHDGEFLLASGAFHELDGHSCCQNMISLCGSLRAH